MVLKNKEITRIIDKKKTSQKDIAKEVGYSESYISLLKSGTRELNPDNPRHVKLSKKLQKLIA